MYKRQLLGYLPQQFGYYKNNTPVQYLDYLAALKNMPKQTAKEKIEQLLELVGLSDVADKKMKKFSGGMIQRVGIAQAMLNDPKVLILDEPTANFDPDFKQDFLNVIMQFMESGKKSVIIASHILDELDRIADYLIYLDKGELVYSGDIESFRDKYRIISGESYKVKLLKQEDIIHVEDRKYGTKALVVNHGYSKYDGALTVTVPTLEEFMYHYSKRGESVI